MRLVPTGRDRLSVRIVGPIGCISSGRHVARAVYGEVPQGTDVLSLDMEHLLSSLQLTDRCDACSLPVEGDREYVTEALFDLEGRIVTLEEAPVGSEWTERWLIEDGSGLRFAERGEAQECRKR